MTEVNDTRSPEQDNTPRPEAPTLGMGDQVHFQRYQQKNSKVLWGIFLLLLALAGGVFFVLPAYVSPPDAATSVVVVPTAPAAQVPALSPFEEAQRLRQREAAQNTLAALLELQEELEKKQVLEWAPEPFNAGLDAARGGDEAYRQQQFIEANARYQAGLDLLQGIKASEASVHTAFLNEGAAALDAGEAEAADRAFSLALLINPDSGEAVDGMERAGVLDQVLALLEAGRALQEQGQLEEAREQFRQAQAIDGAHPQVAPAIEAVNQAIADRDFAAAMSRGYAALQAGQPENALRAFEQARAQRPGSTEVDTAIAQARDQQTFAAISVHIEAAQAAEANENWAAALAAWNEALGIDPNLVTALEGQDRSESRNNLDTFLQATLANPLRLAEESIYNQTRQVLADAARIAEPGPRLREQMQRIGAFLERARIPVSVQLQSDGLTAVTVYRIAELGMFTSQTLSLVPGEYVAVGVRPGYRDVRQEFVVGLDGQAPVVTVACTEAI